MVPQVELFSIAFWENWRHQKDISKLTDFYPKDLSPLKIFRPSYGSTVTLKDRPTVIFQDDCGD